MMVDTHTAPLRLIWEGTGLEIDLTPLQGLWTEAQYLKVTDQINRLVEFTDGDIEVLPMPTENHQAILEFLFLVLRDFITQSGGKARYTRSS